MRVKTGIVRRRKHKKVLRAAKGFRGASGDVIKQAKQEQQLTLQEIEK